MKIFTKNTMKWILLCLTCLVVVIFTGCGSREKQFNQPLAPTDSSIENSDLTLFFVGEEDYAPISFEENGQVVGISPDILREAFRRMGYKINLQLVPWRRAQEMVVNGEADGFFSPYKTPEREKNYTFTKEPLLIEKNIFVVRKDSMITYNGDISTLDKYTIGTLIGYATLEKYLEKKLITNVDKSSNTEIALNKLASGERNVDLVVNTNYILWYTAKKMNLTNSLKELSPPLAEIPSYLAFTKKKDFAEILVKFEFELQGMKKDGTYDKIIQKYIGDRKSN